MNSHDGTETADETAIDRFNPIYVHEVTDDDGDAAGVGQFEFIRDGGRFEIYEEQTEMGSAFEAFEEGDHITAHHDDYGQIDHGEVVALDEYEDVIAMAVDSATTVGPSDVDIGLSEVDR